jgi:hypothetical protein
MILNQRQLGISRKKLADLVTYRETAAQRDSAASKLELDSIGDVIAGLKHEISEYECLFNSHPSQIEVDSLGDLPVAMIRARIASGLTHKELADRLQLTESAVQRYEQRCYRGASFERLCDVVNAIGIPVLVRHRPGVDAEARMATLNKISS